MKEAPKTDSENIRAALKAANGSVRAAAQALGVARSTLQGRMKAAGIAAVSVVRKTGPLDASPSNLLTVDAVVAPHDSVARALDAVRAIPAGRLLPDDALRREVGVGNDRWRSVRGSARLAGFWYALPDRALVWGQKATIAALAAKMKEVA
jgi:hypothetical protein